MRAYDTLNDKKKKAKQIDRERDATCLGHRLGLIAAEHKPAGSHARGGGEALGDDGLGRGRVDGAMACVKCLWRRSVGRSMDGLIDTRSRTNAEAMSPTYGCRKKSMALALIRRSASSREMSPSLNCGGLRCGALRLSR